MSYFFKTYFLYYPIFWLGYFFFKITGKTNWYPYVSFRRLFVLTKGGVNTFLSNRLSKLHPPYLISESKGVLGSLNRNEVRSIVEKIREDGYIIFDSKLSTEAIDELTRFALTTESILVPPSKNGIEKSLYTREKTLSPKYDFPEKDLLKSPLVQRLVSDPTLLAVAQGYLNCKPIQDLTAMWWSTAFSKEASSEAAQLFHFDMDRIKFIKFFFYITDVESYNGPHCFIRGSHKQIPGAIWREGRIPDKEILENFQENDILEIKGVKGTILAVDTRGLHKGKVLEKGERLLLQIEFTNSLFGAEYNMIDVRNNIIPEVRSVFEKYDHTYRRYKV